MVWLGPPGPEKPGTKIRVEFPGVTDPGYKVGFCTILPRLQVSKSTICSSAVTEVMKATTASCSGYWM